MDVPIHVGIKAMGLHIVYLKGSQIELYKLYQRFVFVIFSDHTHLLFFDRYEKRIYILSICTI